MLLVNYKKDKVFAQLVANILLNNFRVKQEFSNEWLISQLAKSNQSSNARNFFFSRELYGFGNSLDYYKG